MIDAAEAGGLLKPGGTIVEPTSGNTGVGLAIVASQRGYNCVFVMTDKVSPEKVDLLRAYGAEVVVCPVAVPPEDPQSYYSVAERLVSEIPGAYRPNQYANQSNPESHYATTGPEIWRQTDGKITHFVAGAGTGGTLGGVARYLKEQNPTSRSLPLTPRARCTAAAQVALIWSRVSAKTSGPKPMTRPSSTVSFQSATPTRSPWPAGSPKRKAC